MARLHAEESWARINLYVGMRKKAGWQTLGFLLSRKLFRQYIKIFSTINQKTTIGILSEQIMIFTTFCPSVLTLPLFFFSAPYSAINIKLTHKLFYKDS